jgi:hypothetical protein
MKHTQQNKHVTVVKKPVWERSEINLAIRLFGRAVKRGDVLTGDQLLQHVLLCQIIEDRHR